MVTTTREILLEAAGTLLNQEGVSHLSLREVARRAGVSHQAPYHYFPDRPSLLAELVKQGFVQLKEKMDKALAETERADRASKVKAVGLAYIELALEQPGIFGIMFRPEIIDLREHPEANEAAEQAYAVLETMVTRLGESPEASTAALHWSFAHGLACLLVDGPLGCKHPAQQERQAFVQSVVTRFAQLWA